MLGIARMAEHLGRHPSTLYREVKRNQSAHDGRYRASHSVEKASGRQHHSRRNRRYGPAEFEPIETLLRQRFSPEQIVGRRQLEGQPVMSHETIYSWIWTDKRCGGSLWRHLRGARKRRRKRYGRDDSRGRLAGKKLIEQRPAVVTGRGRIGDWEMDTVHGRGNACVVTVVERKTGLVRMGTDPTRHQGTDTGTDGQAAVGRTPAGKRPSLRTMGPSFITTRNWKTSWAHRSTLRRRTMPGAGAPTRTPTDSSVNTCPREPT